MIINSKIRIIGEKVFRYCCNIITTIVNSCTFLGN